MVKPPDKQSTLNRYLAPTKEVLKVKGKLSYSESAQAWNTIKIKKEVLLFFPQLKEKRSMFSYTMLVPRSHEEIKEKLAELDEDDNKIPILLFFEKSKQEEMKGIIPEKDD